MFHCSVFAKTFHLQQETGAVDFPHWANAAINLIYLHKAVRIVLSGFFVAVS